jgi:hypothetical protein
MDGHARLAAANLGRDLLTLCGVAFVGLALLVAIVVGLVWLTKQRAG